MQAEELVLRHIGFVIFRIHRGAFPVYARRFGEDILSQTIVVLFECVLAYNLRYCDEQGISSPSVLWELTFHI
ncbi:MAG TPA: hypothetical protein PKI45_07210 [Candidatus Omnitrophota bacterium]|nr:hypothetical protein [Candidatus Omnitrophota bacterium]